jgi:hypothetical protein
MPKETNEYLFGHVAEKRTQEGGIWNGQPINISEELEMKTPAGLRPPGAAD